MTNKMNKTTVTFEISDKHLELLSGIQSKDVQDFTQEDLLDLRTVLQKSLVWETQKDEDKAYEETYKALANMVGNERLFRPMDQRSLPEFTLHHLLKWSDSIDAADSHIIGYEAGRQFYKDLGDSYIISLNDIQAQNYIRAFWDDFIEEYCEGWVGAIFKHPAAFLDQQVGLMAIDLVRAIFEKQQECYMPLDKFKQIVNEMSASDLSDLVY